MDDQVFQLNQQDFNFRFGGIERLYGETNFKRIKEARIMVVGLGGVGSWVVEALARTGVGSLTLVDYDEICLSNTNRQLHAMDGAVGRLKCEVLASRIFKINPSCQVVSLDKPYGLDSEEDIFNQPFDVVVDAIDHGLTKFHLVKACHSRKTPIIVSGAAGGRVNPTLIRTDDLSRSSEDPMLSILRKDLRRKAKYPRTGKMGVPCVYSLEKPRYPDQGACSSTKPESFKKPLDCSTGFGTATHITGSFGFAMAHLALSEVISL